MSNEKHVERKARSPKAATPSAPVKTAVPARTASGTARREYLWRPTGYGDDGSCGPDRPDGIARPSPANEFKAGGPPAIGARTVPTPPPAATRRPPAGHGNHGKV
jgi:hypothetical protein